MLFTDPWLTPSRIVPVPYRCWSACTVYTLYQPNRLFIILQLPKHPGHDTFGHGTFGHDTTWSRCDSRSMTTRHFDYGTWKFNLVTSTTRHVTKVTARHDFSTPHRRRVNHSQTIKLIKDPYRNNWGLNQQNIKLIMATGGVVFQFKAYIILHR